MTVSINQRWSQTIVHVDRCKMVSNNFYRGHALRIAVQITILILLLVVGLAAAIPETSITSGIPCEVCPGVGSSTVPSTSKISAITVESNVFSPFANEYMLTGSEGGSAFYFPSNGNGIFGTKSVVYSARTVDGITIADFDNDGDLDFVMGDGNTDSIILFRNDGGGIYNPITVATNVLGGTPFFSQFRAADFNGDGKMDFIAGGFTTSPDRQFVFLNLGNNVFTPSPIDVSWRSGVIFVKEVGDFNNDGKQDMLIGDVYGTSSGKVFLYKGNGDGTFQTPVLAININLDHNIIHPFGLAAGDFNLDGKLDIVIGGAQNSGEFWLYKGNGDGTFTAGPSVFNLKGAGAGFVGIDAFDFDKDGKSDVVGTNWEGGQLWYVKGKGDGTFESPVLVESGLPLAVGIAAPPDKSMGIAIVSPNGVQNWEPGTTNTIKWNYVGNIGSNVKIELLKSGTVKTIASKVSIGTGGIGSYDWKISPNQPSGEDYQIRITSTTNSLYTDTSDYFGIDLPEITSMTPTSGVKGMAITIHGKNFGGSPGAVLFGDTPAKLGQPNDEYGKAKWSDTQIVALVPEKGSGCDTIFLKFCAVSVKTKNNILSNSLPFTYLDVPVVSQWRWPRDNAAPIPGWGYGDDTIYGSHTGIDIYEEKKGIITPVFAAADGIVVAKCPNGEICKGFSNNKNKDNHGLFGVVILAHRLASDGTLVYSMYADMSDVSDTPDPGTTVHMGEILGKPGITWKGDWKTHVHFEIKNEPVLHNPSWVPGSTPHWGYIKNEKNLNPDNYGYKNPNPFINLPAPTLIYPIQGIKKVSITPTMSWSSDIQLNRIQVSSDINFKNIVFDQSDIITNSITIPEQVLQHKIKYWWRVNARNSGGAGFWSKVESFTTI